MVTARALEVTTMDNSGDLGRLHLVLWIVRMKNRHGTMLAVCEPELYRLAKNLLVTTGRYVHSWDLMQSTQLGGAGDDSRTTHAHAMAAIAA